MSPISTAHLNPYGETFCLTAPGQNILIPILLNNTNPVNVRYTLTPLGYVESADDAERTKSPGKVERVELSAKDLKAIEAARLEGLQVARTAASKRDSDDYDEYDDDDQEDEEPSDSRRSPSLQKSQTLAHIRLNKPGRLRLERVLDASSVDARLVYPSEVTVVPCPRAEFALDSSTVQEHEIRCAVPGLSSGLGGELNLEIDIYGVPPLSLRWYKEVEGRKESFMVEGIENSGHAHHRSAEGRAVAQTAGSRAPAELKIPLTVSLDALGTHSYVLESVADGIGNVISAGLYSTSLEQSSSMKTLRKITSNKAIESSAGPKSKIHRSVTVLPRSSVSFQNCGPGNPASLLINSKALLTISAKNADQLDSPWEIDVKYTPPAAEEGSKSSTKKLKTWTRTLQTVGDHKDLHVEANAPGEYSIIGVKGRYCEGDILSPETCRVVERPLPTAQIEWKKIHEWSVRQ